MPTTKLLEQLLDIERSVGYADNLTIRAMLMEAQAEVLRVQAGVIQVLEDIRELREQQERIASSALSPGSARAERPVAGLTRLVASTV
jgi:hypothetical protein